MEKSKFYQIKNITEHEYVLVGCDGSVITRPIQDIDKSASAFTIEDAKDGDVLVTGKENIFIFKSISGYAVYDYCGLYFGKFMDDSANVNSPTSAPIGYHPATKEQRDTLKKAMADAGFTFDFEKKELKKIKDEIEIPYGSKDSELQEDTYYIPKGFHAEIDKDKVVIKMGKKPAWSEEYIADVFEKVGLAKIVREQSNDALTIALQDAMIELSKVTLQPKPTTWSEEDEYCRHQLIVFCENCMVQDAGAKRCTHWLKSLKNRVQPQLKQEWNEEDEGILDEIIDFLENGTVKLQHDLSLYASWLKSLKDRYAWRASWEQLDALEYHLKHTNENSRLYKETKKLYDQLKKL